MSRRDKRLTKRDRKAVRAVGTNAEAPAHAQPLPKLSATILQFAKPLLDAFAIPPEPEELETLIHIATIAWNLPLFEQRRSTEARRYRAALKSVLTGAPPAIAEAISAMLHARLATYAADPRLGFVEVIDIGDGRARVNAASVRFSR